MTIGFNAEQISNALIDSFIALQKEVPNLMINKLPALIHRNYKSNSQN